MEPRELWMTGLRAFALYVLVLVVLRILGKRTVGNFTAFDLLVALMLGEVVDEVIYGDVSFLQGGVAILVVASAHYANAWLVYWRPGLHRLLEGSPVLVVEHGKLVRRGMRRERMNEQDLEAALRLRGIDDLQEVRRAHVETDGKVSVLRESWAEELQRGDWDEHVRPQLRAAAGDRRER